MRGMCMFVQPLNALTAGASGRPSPSDTSHHPAHGSASKSGAQSPASSPPHQMHWPYHYASWCHPRVAPQHSPSSLTPGVAVGIAIFHVDTSDDDPANPARCIAFGHFDLASWNDTLTKEPAYQNTREFCGALFGVIFAHDLQATGFLPQGPINFHWHGDNTSALSWIDNNKVRSAQTQKIFMAYTWLRLRRPINIPWTTHKPGKPWAILTRYHVAGNCSHSCSTFVSIFGDHPNSRRYLPRSTLPHPLRTCVPNHTTSLMAIHHHVAAIHCVYDQPRPPVTQLARQPPVTSYTRPSLV